MCRKRKIIQFALAIIAFYIITNFSIYRVQGDSMLPTLYSGQFIITTRNTSTLQYGDVVVALMDSEGESIQVVKRVIGLEGDEVVIQNSHVWVNGEQLDESYLFEDTILGEYTGTVPDGYVFIVGDNRNSSYDSRDVGGISVEKVFGKVLFNLSLFKKL